MRASLLAFHFKLFKSTLIMPILLLLLLIVFDQINECYAVSSATPICGACSLLVNELETSINNVNANKKIQIGSFRVDPKGNQDGLNEVPFARSEAHIYDLLEDICAKSRDYVLVVNPTTGKAVYRRADLTKLDGDKSRETLLKLESACGDFLDDHEEELIEFVRTAHPEPIRQFCHQQTGVCTSVDVTPFPATDTSDEKPDKSSDDEKTDKSLDVEKSDKSSADYEKPDKSSEDDEKPDKSSADEKPDKSSDDEKPDKSSDDEKPDKSSTDEKPDKLSDDEKPDKSSDDEKPDKSSGDEKPDKSSDDEKTDEKTTDDDGTDSEKKKTIDNGSDGGGVGDKDEL